MLRSWTTRYGILTAAVALLPLPACESAGRPLSGPKPDSTEVAALATHYQFVNPMAPVPAVVPLPAGTDVPDADAPIRITIARAMPTGPAPTGKVILALVSSDKPYKHLGIRPGDNYVWRDERNADPKRWVTFMVPVTASSGARKLKRDTAAYSMGDHAQPRLVRAVTHSLSFGVCLDDPACGSGHCGYGEVDAF